VKGWGGDRSYSSGRRVRGVEGTSRGKSVRLWKRRIKKRRLKARKNGDFEKRRGGNRGWRGADQTR
jgi:hypothetical protein